eukprot:TRINITY_DN12147_c0_g1_i1.p1 TRINITY_DN12147_c0_g1~~TRINITY_DN12147_c0_g1_i1.p1  ORF type:complete len:70 (+),score=0.77 TRINITY_DN12147_c0_g1_i1:257-466(+)
MSLFIEHILANVVYAICELGFSNYGVIGNLHGLQKFHHLRVLKFYLIHGEIDVRRFSLPLSQEQSIQEF